MRRFLHFVALVALAADLWAFDFSPAVDRAVLAIDVDQWYADIKYLSSLDRFYRHNDIHRARDWLVEQFSKMGLTTSTEEIVIRGVRGFNVIAELASANESDDIYIVGAHYDSIAENTRVLAPGAEDNASGTAGLLAVARALLGQPLKARVRFVAFSGEEAGLVGSKAHVANIIARGEREQIRGVLIMDMIGYTSDLDLDALIETSDSNQDLVRLLTASAQKYSQGRIETSYYYWGSDHVPFINNGFSAALLAENDYEQYPDYHRSTDVIENINKDMGEVILKMLTGAVGYWLL